MAVLERSLKCLRINVSRETTPRRYKQAGILLFMWDTSRDLHETSTYFFAYLNAYRPNLRAKNLVVTMLFREERF